MSAGAEAVLERFAALGLASDEPSSLEALLDDCRRHGFLSRRRLARQRWRRFGWPRGRPRDPAPSCPRVGLSKGLCAGAATMACSGALDEPVRALLDRDRPLGGGAHGQTGYAQEGRLLLQPSRIGDHETGSAQQGHEVEVAQRREDPHAPAPVRRRSPAQALPRARMHGKDHRQPFAHVRNAAMISCRSLVIVDVGRTVQRDYRVASGLPVRGRRGPSGRRPREGRARGCRS